jgi:hypothetical protein
MSEQEQDFDGSDEAVSEPEGYNYPAHEALAHRVRTLFNIEGPQVDLHVIYDKVTGLYEATVKDDEEDHILFTAATREGFFEEAKRWVREDQTRLEAEEDAEEADGDESAAHMIARGDVSLLKEERQFVLDLHREYPGCSIENLQWRQQRMIEAGLAPPNEQGVNTEADLERDKKTKRAKLLREEAARLLYDAQYAEAEAACFYNAQGMSAGDRQTIYSGWLDDVRPILPRYTEEELDALLDQPRDRTTTV